MQMFRVIVVQQVIRMAFQVIVYSNSRIIERWSVSFPNHSFLESIPGVG